FFSATPHASMVKAFAIAGIGRSKYVKVDTLPDSEAMDVVDLEKRLLASNAAGKVVVASAGTVTGTDFDDLETIADLCEKHKAWLHVDGAFGLFTRLIPERQHWTKGIERADSITSDGHKWLNVPYDSGIFLTRHIKILQQVCSVAAPYLDLGNDMPDFMDRGIENSRRFRALPVWMALKAYGYEGHRAIVEHNCEMASLLADFLENDPRFELLHPCNLNVVVFRLQGDETGERTARLLNAINKDGRVFLTPGQWKGKKAIRAAFSNWRILKEDVIDICNLLEEKFM
ncbi:MAG: aminotransferase class I/II-fold pyridoxal phosphate-dependent enzyme, partial [Alphaproteobacteria bacterium]|nr:aminotransferase class I/II-fold pyridoxal phosphate-dependent enzyme [Alphaproteobacteria bacterium]